MEEGEHKINSKLVKMVKRIFRGAVSTCKEELACYAYDASLESSNPDLVAYPQDAEQIANLMDLAQREGFPVVPRGAGTGLSGGSVPLRGGVIVSLQKMNRIREIDCKNCLAIVEAGVVTGNLQEIVWKKGMFYPPDPGSAQVCTIGGNIAENAGGPRALKYGVTRDYLLGLEIVTPTGDIIRTGGKTLKNVTGYDLTRFMAGSEGTLGIVTQATVKLLPSPRSAGTLMLTFSDLDKAAHTVCNIISGGVLPTTLEFMDNLTIRCVEDYLHAGLPLDAAAILLVEVDGRKEVVDMDLEEICTLAKINGAVSVRRAVNQEERDLLWRARRSVSASLSRIKPAKISEDATVPRSRIPDLVRSLHDIARRYELRVAVFGHAGDGNLHPNFLVDIRDQEEMKRLKKAVEELFQVALELDGTLSGEHGIGYTKASFLENEIGASGIKFLSSLKRAVDPAGVLNPGKIFK